MSDSSERESSSLLSSGNARFEALLVGCENCQYEIYLKKNQNGRQYVSDWA